MATAMKARQTSKRSAGRAAEMHGRFTAQRSEGGQWVDVIREKYDNDHHRANLHRAYSEWVNNAPTGDVRRAVEHCTIDGKPRHIIRAESAPTADIEPWSEVDLVLGMYNRQGVDYTEPSIQ